MIPFKDLCYSGTAQKTVVSVISGLFGILWEPFFYEAWNILDMFVTSWVFCNSIKSAA